MAKISELSFWMTAFRKIVCKIQRFSVYASSEMLRKTPVPLVISLRSQCLFSVFGVAWGIQGDCF
ncbi:MAG: hypothetical protein ABIK47_03025 [candidate division WOR-3 bacterium]